MNRECTKIENIFEELEKYCSTHRYRNEQKDIIRNVMLMRRVYPNLYKLLEFFRR